MLKTLPGPTCSIWQVACDPVPEYLEAMTSPGSQHSHTDHKTAGAYRSRQILHTLLEGCSVTERAAKHRAVSQQYGCARLKNQSQASICQARWSVVQKPLRCTNAAKHPSTCSRSALPMQTGRNGNVPRGAPTHPAELGKTG